MGTTSANSPLVRYYWGGSLVVLSLAARDNRLPFMFENEQLVKRYLLWFAVSHSPASVSSYRYALRRFIKYLGNRAIETILIEDVCLYIQALRDEGIKEGTVSIYITALRSFASYLEDKELLLFKAKAIPVVSADNVVSHEFATPEEVMAILGVWSDLFPLDCRNKAMISLTWDTGVRLSELLSLNVEDIDLINKRGRVKTYKRKNEMRDIYWETDTNDILKKWLLFRDEVLIRDGAHTNALFLSLATNTKALRCHRHAVQKALIDARKKAGVKRHITPHSLRHGYCTLRAKLNMNVNHLQRLMGHAKLTSTQVYVHLTNNELENEYRKIYKRQSPQVD